MKASDAVAALGEVAAGVQDAAEMCMRSSAHENRARRYGAYRATSAGKTMFRRSVATVPRPRKPVAGTAPETRYLEFRLDRSSHRWCYLWTQQPAAAACGRSFRE